MEQRTVHVSNEWMLTRLLSSLALLAAPVLGATETFTATAHSRLPLLEVVEKVEAEYLWRINYEDPPFENVNEIEDLTSPIYKASHSNPKRCLSGSPGEAFYFLVGGFRNIDGPSYNSGTVGQPTPQLR